MPLWKVPRAEISNAFKSSAHSPDPRYLLGTTLQSSMPPLRCPAWVLTWAEGAGSALNAVRLVRPTQPIQSEAVQGPRMQVPKHS